MVIQAIRAAMGVKIKIIAPQPRLAQGRVRIDSYEC